jgi:hypothetical protein
MPGEYDFKGPEHYKALLQHHTNAMANAALATGLAKQDHLQRAKFYAQKVKEHPLYPKKEDVAVNESLVDTVKRGAAHVKRSATVAAGKTILSSPPGTDEIGKFPGAYTVAAGAGHFVDELTGGKLGAAVERVANKAKGAVSGVRKTLKMGEDWAVGSQEGPTPVLAIQASRKKSKYKDPEGGMAFGEDAEPLEERRGLMRMALRGVRMARIRAQREAQKAAEARREAEAAGGGGGDDEGPKDLDQPMFRKPGSQARKFKTEETMTDSEKAEREKIVMGMKKNKSELQKRYGDRWKEVMYATATKQAMEGKVSSELPTNPKNLPVLKERDPHTGRLLRKSRAARRVEEIVNCGKNKIDTEPEYNQLNPGNGGTGYVNK